jgi:hypothetical protein
MYVYKGEPFSGMFFKDRVAGINWGSYYALKRHVAQGHRDHLDRVHSDQKILEMIRQGEAGPCYQSPRVTNSKNTVRLKSTQIRWFS